MVRSAKEVDCATDCTPLLCCNLAHCRYPKLIHQTIRNKSEITCSQQRNMNSWRRLNPGFQLKLWDDQDIRAFVNEHYPELMPTPFDDFLSGVERSDFWRVLVLHKVCSIHDYINKCFCNSGTGASQMQLNPADSIFCA